MLPTATSWPWPRRPGVSAKGVLVVSLGLGGPGTPEYAQREKLNEDLKK